jgi:hypothetical protein
LLTGGGTVTGRLLKAEASAPAASGAPAGSDAPALTR